VGKYRYNREWVRVIKTVMLQCKGGLLFPALISFIPLPLKTPGGAFFSSHVLNIVRLIKYVFLIPLHIANVIID